MSSDKEGRDDSLPPLTPPPTVISPPNSLYARLTNFLLLYDSVSSTPPFPFAFPGLPYQSPIAGLLISLFLLIFGLEVP